MSRVTLIVILLFIGSVLLTAKWKSLDADGYFSRAEKRARAGRFSEAISDYTNAIRLMPENMENFRKRAIAYMNLTDYTLAIADQEIVLRQKPDYASVYYDRGIALYFLERHQAACRDMTTACGLGYDMACLQKRQACDTEDPRSPGQNPIKRPGQSSGGQISRTW